MNKSLAFVGAALLFGYAASSHALTFSYDYSSTTSQAGATTLTFGVSPINNNGVVSGALPSGTAGGVTYSYTGGALFNYDPYPASNLANGISARPPGSTGNYWSIGASPAAQNGPGVATFAEGLSYFGFLWGSPDAYNILSFYDGNTLLGTYNGSLILQPPNGNQAYSAYLNVFAGSGEKITKVTFGSTTNAFETDNHSFIAAAAVPEPMTGALALAGMGMLGFARRKQKRTA